MARFFSFVLLVVSVYLPVSEAGGQLFAQVYEFDNANCNGTFRVTDFLPNGECVNQINCDPAMAICQYRHYSHKALCNEDGTVSYLFYEAEDCSDDKPTKVLAPQQYSKDSCMRMPTYVPKYRQIKCTEVSNLIQAKTQVNELNEEEVEVTVPGKVQQRSAFCVLGRG